MNVTSLYRRGIVLPLTKSALDQIRRGDVTTNTEVDVLGFHDGDFFYRIWETGIFDRINKICNSIVDDYEEEEVGCNLGKAARTLRKELCSDARGDDLNQFILRFCDLCEKAEKLKMPLFFIL